MVRIAGSIRNKTRALCMVEHNNLSPASSPGVRLPVYARVPINRCNLPAVIVGSLSFQRHPTTVLIDGVHELHRRLFDTLDTMRTHEQRAQHFMDYMTVHFCFDHLEEAGLELNANKTGQRNKADYLRILRGWLFDSDGREAAVLKSWVESRFGLLPRYHHGPLHTTDRRDMRADNHNAYLEARARGLYATNALEAQLDLLYSYCQYELGLDHAPDAHIRLYRGVNRLHEFEVLEQHGRHEAVVLLNNLNSFTRNRERADEFGDFILGIDACWQKIMFYSDLLPGFFSGEEEVLVIGGVYEVDISI
jgi:NAD+--dinitrogen-reductase ADP-D-ribosyltransferase